MTTKRESSTLRRAPAAPAADWWLGEEAIRVPAIADHVPRMANGRRVSAATCWRWTLRGIDGLKIRRFRVGGSWATTRQEVERWTAALTAASESA